MPDVHTWCFSSSLPAKSPNQANGHAPQPQPGPAPAPRVRSLGQSHVSTITSLLNPIYDVFLSSLRMLEVLCHLHLHLWPRSFPHLLQTRLSLLLCLLWPPKVLQDLPSPSGTCRLILPNLHLEWTTSLLRRCPQPPRTARRTRRTSCLLLLLVWALLHCHLLRL